MKKSICFVIGVLARKGGTERVCTNIANALSNTYDVSILSTWDEGEPGYTIDNKVKVHYLMRRFEGKIYHFFPSYFTIKYTHFFRKYKFDVVIDVDICLAKYSIPAVRGLKTKVIDWEQFNYWHNANDPELASIQRLAIRESSKIVVLTKRDYAFYHDDGHVPYSKLAQIYNTTPMIGARPSDRKNKLAIAVGRLTEQKGFDILLHSWTIVEKALPEWKLAIIGSGEDESKLKRLALELNLKNVSFVPATKDIEYWYNQASCFLLSSRYEGFVMVLLEAMAKGLPPVAFDCVAGPSEIIEDGVNGFLVPLEGGFSAFANKTIELLSSSDLQSQFAYKARLRSFDYSIDIICDQWKTVIQDVLDN
ncbi:MULTISPECIES: glycosyltransferase family 4 protein [unclassified Bifidobacterium]|uniref:glycosyltransferase family 4 protein n=1 Tax=unclassified Bifidobacterium TaxID=2608897 RepID=UPI00112E9C1F|nr:MULTISPECIES: glycosyltransferase family 4 protein [unclassified Bifidobacterium]